MRPPEARQISMARSSAQSECGELSTGTKTSLYGMTPPSAVMGSKNSSELRGLSTVLQSRRCATTPAHQHPSILAHCARENRYLESRARCARSCSSRQPRPNTFSYGGGLRTPRRREYEPAQNTCQVE